MKDVKLKERFEKAFGAFFEDTETDSTYLEKMSDDGIVKESIQKTKVKTIFKILKQVFLFFPATFFTFYMWMGMMIFGFSNSFSLIPLFFFILMPILMVLGMGNIKNIRHWIMPLSVIILGSLIGIITGNVPILRSFIASFQNAILFFPLALILAILSKNWADNSDEKDSL